VSAIQGAAPELEASGATGLGESRDALFGGSLALSQPARGAGYRANVDALLLAAFAGAVLPPPAGVGLPPPARVGMPPPAGMGMPPGSARRTRVAFDLGAGCGAVGLSLLHFGATGRVVLVEKDAYAAALAQANLEANGWLDRGEVLLSDVSSLDDRAGEADLVVCNPPYVPPGHGRVPKGLARAFARTGELSQFTRAARVVLGRRARACFVYPAHALAALLTELRAAGLEAKRMRAVHARVGAPARLMLVESQAAKAGGLTVEPPLFERDGHGYGAELRALLAG
jgi:tRNA1Val (adenine37-N6)-methyltransferase